MENASPVIPLLWPSIGIQGLLPFLLHFLWLLLLWEARKGTAQNGKEKIERDEYMGEKRKKPTFFLTKGSCWLIALGNTQRLLCNAWLSMQGLLSTAAIEEEGEKKELKWIQGLFTEKCPSHIITLLSNLVKKNN